MAETTQATLAVKINDIDLGAAGRLLFSDETSSLVETVTLLSATPGLPDVDANWTTYYSVHFGVEESVSGNWNVYLMPVYGTGDTAEKPFYSRLVIPASFPDGTVVNIDSVASAEIIGHGQAIPPTVVVWNPTTSAVVSSTEGHTLAFSDTTRIKANPNNTGFDDNGEFVLRYDHTIEAEGRSVFYAAASWPCQWVNGSTKEFRRGDKPGAGFSKGYTLEERGPYIEWFDYAPDTRNPNGLAVNYPITHLDYSTRDIRDEKKWDNSWTAIGYGQRADSGIGPFCGNLVSRGSSYLRDFGMAWIAKSLAARILTQFPSPSTPHARNKFTYNYDADAMRGKGRTLWVMALLWRAMLTIEGVRDTSVDTEVTDLKNDLAVRAVDVLNLLKTDFDNDSWRSSQSDATYGRGIPYWEAMHYWQGLLIYQEAVRDLTGAIDPKVHEMMVTIASEVYDNTLLWTNNGPHPRDANVTYTGGENGYYVEYIKFDQNPGNSWPSDGISPKAGAALFSWLKLNGLKQGATLDAIITQHAGQSYRWQLGSGAPLSGSFSATMAVTLDTGAPTITHGGGVDLAMVMALRATPTITGGGLYRKGSTLALTTGKSVGTAIAVGPGYNVMGEAAFSVIRGDRFKQPFTVTLDQSRTLDGTESWKFSVRETKDSDLLLTLTSPVGIEIDGGTFQPTVVFESNTFDNGKFPSRIDKEFVFDLEMTKDGHPETYAIDTLTVVGDVSR